MFKDITYEGVLDEMLIKATELFPDLDTREGSVLHTALAPAAVEIVNIYIALDNILDMSFPDTASRDYLLRRCNERGISPGVASCAIIAANCLPDGVYVPEGTRFSCAGSTYAVTGERIGSHYLMECETVGSRGNRSGGTLLPLTYVEGLISATIAGLTVPGEDEEDTEALRARYFDSFNSQAFSGNVKDYREKVTAINGVGAVKVYPAYMGGGTVKLVIIGSDYSAPSETLINMVQTMIDPVQNSGEGLGIAPIGHSVTVVGVLPVSIDIDLRITYTDGWIWNDLSVYVSDTVDEYFKELCEGWIDSDSIIVRISQLEAKLLELVGIKDVVITSLRGQTANLYLGENEIPVRGNISG